MSVTRKNVEFAKRIFSDRLGDPYVFGGNWDPFNLGTGTDCSGLVGDILDAVNEGTAMPWQRSVSTESWPYDYATDTPAPPGTVGPKGTIAIAHPSDAPADAAVIVSIMHRGGGVNSHTNCQLDGIVMESNGEHGTCGIGTGAVPITDAEWTDWWYLPGPIIEDGTPVVAPEPKDTLFADVSEFQVPVNDSYPYQVLSIRVCDGTYQDHNFAENYAWMKSALDSGKLAMGIVYTYVRPDWQGNVSTVRQRFADNGGLHPKVVIMLDVESGGNPAGDGSAWINAVYNDMVAFTGDARRVIGYGNVGDLNSIWLSKPAGVRLIVAGYGSNPDYPGKIAHQYTDGQGFGGGLPEGCPPFGTNDMNSADGLTPSAFAAACGITDAPPVVTPPPPTTGDDPLSALTDDEAQELLTKVRQIWDQLQPWPQLGHNAAGQNLTLVDAVASVETMIEKLGIPVGEPTVPVTEAPVEPVPTPAPVAPVAAEPSALNMAEALAQLVSIFQSKGK